MWQHDWMNTQVDDPLALDPRVLARRLAQSAGAFDNAAVLHREVSRRLVERLDFIKLAPRRMLDLGCASGLNTAALRKRYPKARYVAADLAAPLVAQTRRRSGRLRPVPGVATTLDQLPFANDSFDLVFSSLVLHRQPDLASTARELQRVLRPDGVLMFATFGPDTLSELRSAWASVDQTPHVHGFIDMHDIGDALVGAKLADPVMDMEHFTLTYPEVDALIDDLTSLGLRNALVGRQPGLTTPRRWQAMQQAYARNRDANGQLPATWEVAYGHAWGTDAQAQMRGPAGEVRMPLTGLSMPTRRRDSS